MSLEDMSAFGGEKILVEVFSMVNARTPVEELVTAVAKSGRWKDRLETRVIRVDEWPTAETPYGTISDNMIVVSGTHIISGNDYWGLQNALEACESGDEDAVAN